MKNIVITGGSSGLGLGLCKRYAKEGHKVFTCSRNKTTVYNVDHFKADLANIKDVRAFSDHIKDKVENIDVLINNAGISPGAYLLNFSWELFKKTIDVNFTSHRILVDLIENIFSKKGCIINIISRVALEGRKGLSAYGCSKELFYDYTKYLAYKYPYLRVYGVNPGFMKTGMADEKSFEKQKETSIIKKDIDPDDSANIIYQLSFSKIITNTFFDFDSRIYSVWKK